MRSPIRYKESRDAHGTFVCINCIGEPYLRKEIKEIEDNQWDCSYCGADTYGASLDVLSDRIHDVLQSQFNLTPDEPSDFLDLAMAQHDIWERSGAPVQEIISDVAKVGDEIAEDIRACLSDFHGHDAAMVGEEDPYNEYAQYSEQKIRGEYFLGMWEKFCFNLKWKSRFYTTSTELNLDEIFGDFDRHRTSAEKGVLKEIQPTSDDRFIYRARATFSEDELKEILKHPALNLGAPPSRLARAGRMNAAGISVFYGATEAETCIAEIRAPVGSLVVVGRFEIIRPIKLLDLDALSEVYEEGSRFDPNFGTRKQRAAFLRHFVDMITRPVLPNAETFEYLPTQMLSEYLSVRGKPPVDGILFRSAQTGGVGKNIVLFNHASSVDSDGTEDIIETHILETHIFTGLEPPGELDSTIFIYNKKSPQKLKEKEITPESVTFNLLSFTPTDEPLKQRHTLRLDINSMQVLHISSIQYGYNRSGTQRYTE